MAAPLPPSKPNQGPGQSQGVEPSQGSQKPPTLMEQAKNWLSSLVTTPKATTDAQKMDQMRGMVKDLSQKEEYKMGDIDDRLATIKKQTEKYKKDNNPIASTMEKITSSTEAWKSRADPMGSQLKDIQRATSDWNRRARGERSDQEI